MNFNFHFRIASILVKLLDTQFKIFRFRFGLDPILGLIPGGGDLVSLLLSFYLIWLAVRMDLPKNRILEMLKNIIFDFLIGLIPVLGDIGDFVYKANSKNLEILKKHTKTKIIEGETVT